jgi:ATP-dependent RNA/DNA helicase IGHMBP2
MIPPVEENTEKALKRLADLWRRERDATHQRTVAERKATPLKKRVERGVALVDLAVLDQDAATGGRTLVWLAPRKPGRDLDDLRVGPGDPVRLWTTDPDTGEVVLAVVARRRGDRLAVMLDGELPEGWEDGGFNLDRDDPQATFERGARALGRFLSAGQGSDTARLRAVLFGERGPAIAKRTPAWTPLDPHLNGPQQDAVTRALMAEDLALIHGPPGTGKTRTLVEVVRQAVARGERVLVAAASNAAVDTLAERLVLADLDVVRLGHPARVSRAIEPHTLDARLEATPQWALSRRWVADAQELKRTLDKRRAKGKLDRDEARDLRKEIGRLFRDARVALQGAEGAIVGRASVVCATAAGADAQLLGDTTFDLVVLDEATQAPDPIALVPLLRGRRAVLAGDPCQLPPTVIDREAERLGLGTTFFERLRAGPHGPDLLRLLVVQHRMHETIMAFPSEASYEGKLVAHESVARHTLEGLGHREDPLRPGPLVLIDTAGKGWAERRDGEDPSSSNPEQAERSAREVRRLLSRGLPPADVALITPYDAQARLLRELLHDEVQGGLEVGTVDGFQGREKEAIVLDLVRSNEDGQVGFLADTRRMNVALTRARRFLLVLGDTGTIGNHPYYAAFLDGVKVLGAWVSAWNDEAEPIDPA